MKKEEIPLLPLFLTEGKKNEIAKELHVLEKEVLPSIRKRMAAAYEDGDIPENNPFITAHEDLQKAMKRRNELREMLVRAKLYKPHKEHGLVHLGSTVTVQFQSGKTSTYTLVESEEADPSNGKLSIDSPIGKELLGKHTRTTIEISTPMGKEKVEILA